MQALPKTGISLPKYTILKYFKNLVYIFCLKQILVFQKKGGREEQQC